MHEPRPKKSGARRLTSLPRRLSDVMSRVPVNIGKVIAADEGVAIIRAAIMCRDCRNAAPCGDWIRAHEEGSGSEPPGFCRIGGFLKTANTTIVGAKGRLRAKGTARVGKPKPKTKPKVKKLPGRR